MVGSRDSWKLQQGIPGVSDMLWLVNLGRNAIQVDSQERPLCAGRKLVRTLRLCNPILTDFIEQSFVADL